MKKILNILFLMVMTAALSAQTTLTFEGKDRTGQDYVQLSRVSVFDLDQLWHQEIFYPDTTLVLYVNGTVGVETMCTSSLQMQNNPNPFDGATDVILCTPYDGDVTMEIADVNGHIVGTHSVRPQPGTHQFRLTLSTPGTYVLTARQNGRTVSVKMVNAGNGGNNGIEYTGTVETGRAPSLQLKSGTRGNGNYPFKDWDMMHYTGYAMVDNVEIESQTVEKAQYGSETIPLKFDVARPEVVTNDASNIAASAATLHGEVTADNNVSVTERGFCYGTGNNPSLSGLHVSVNGSVGTFSTQVGGLSPATNYNVRAYATNMVGTTYGQQKSFRTLDTLPVVTTTEPSDITATTFISGGDVLVLNSNSLTARGICWNTTGAPTIADSHTTQSGGLGSFTSNVTGLDCGTTYYVRAYATNSAGTAYGEEFSVTTAQELAQVITANNISDITDNSAVCDGEVSYDGCSEVTARGVCWNTTGTPTIADSHTTDGNGMGDFTSHLMGLNYATTYYVRAYATNGVGTAYDEELSFTTQPILPTVTTTDATDITATSFICGGDVTNDGGAEVTSRGICWSANPNPTIADSYTTDGDGTGTFTSNVNELSCGTTYYVRAYATNSVGTAYGEEYTVTTTDTLPKVELHMTQVCATTIVVESEVLIENCAMVTARGVCWNTTGSPTVTDSHTTDGSGTGTFISNMVGLNSATTYYVRVYATNSVGTVYGEEHMVTTLPSSLPEVTIVTTIIYNGLNIVTLAEVMSENCSSVTARGICWNTSPTPTISDNHTDNGNGQGIFSDTLTELEIATTFYIRAYATNESGTAYSEEVSVTTANFPTITTTAVTDITSSSATSGGNVTSDGGAMVTARGVCWSTEQNPTIADNHTFDGTGMGDFNSILTELTAGTTYYVRAYATNSLGTIYGDMYNFTTINGPCLDAPIITDIDGNTYNTVQIGSQCWMKENLRTTKYADGTSISQGNTASITVGYWYYPNNDTSNFFTYGLLYNWKAVMRGGAASSATPSGVQGICPTGWHVPSDAEWKQMEMAVGMSQNEADSTGYRGNIAAKLSGNIGWQRIIAANAAGNLSAEDRNSSGFSALPAGYANDRYGNFGYNAYFWSATVTQRILQYTQAGVWRTNGQSKDLGSSVRCVKD